MKSVRITRNKDGMWNGYIEAKIQSEEIVKDLREGHANEGVKVSESIYKKIKIEAYKFCLKDRDNDD